MCSKRIMNKKRQEDGFFLLQLGLGLGSLDINHNLSIIFPNSGLFSDANAPSTV